MTPRRQRVLDVTTRMHLEVDEPIIAMFPLDVERWKTFRCCTCAASVAGAGAGLGGLLFSLPYWLCGESCRQEEAASFSLSLTATTLHYKQKFYGCGCCCQSTITKSIPLDKIQARGSGAAMEGSSEL
jgi:hypothetical protein